MVQRMTDIEEMIRRMMDKKSYIYDSVEVMLTGRKASKKVKRRRRIDTETLYEVTPCNIEVGTWKRWVKPEELYVIEEDE